jgi:OPA family glycerol-3-phosphate transporter-like MFS transporter
MLALFVAVFIFLTVRDTPQSQGLPTIEEYKNDYPTSFGYQESHEKEFSAKEIFFEYVLNNKLLWAIAVANAFVYLVRYGVLDWAPTYLQEEKGFSFDESSWAYALYEWAGIPGTIACGYLSDKLFQGRRAPAVIIYMLATLACVVVYWLNPPGHPGIDIAMLIAIGFLIYGPVMLIGVFALDLVPKKAAGTAAGFTGLFGYVGGSLTASVLIGYVVDKSGWDAGFSLIVGACILAIILTAFTVGAEKRAIK